jgi:ABC-type transport system involved in cytochrome c biogenesis ATPase subunit
MATPTPMTLISGPLGSGKTTLLRHIMLSPPLQKIPWQPNAKEFANHLAWTMMAEAIYRATDRIAA